MYLNFIRLHFKTAKEAIVHVDESLSRGFREFLENMDEDLIKDGEFTQDEFVRVIALMKEYAKNRKLAIPRMLAYDRKIREDKSKYDLVLREVLTYFNPNWKLVKYDYDSERQALKVSGKKP